MIHLGKFEGVLLASDFDDTLVGSDCEVSRGNREALEYFVREGGRFTVSTGRAHRTFAPYVDAAQTGRGRSTTVRPARKS